MDGHYVQGLIYYFPSVKGKVCSRGSVNRHIKNKIALAERLACSDKCVQAHLYLYIEPL